MSRLQAHLEARRADCSKSLVAYVTAGLTPDWLVSIGVLAEAGADVIEVGLPFSDPMLDGPVIQRASFQALQNGMTPLRALEMLRGLDVGVPLVAMSYANPVVRHGEEPFCAALAEAGISGLIVPDLTGSSAGELAHQAAVHDVDLVPMIAPSTSADRRRGIVQGAMGFVYVVSAMAPTGEQRRHGDWGAELCRELRNITDLPLIVGFGVTGPSQAKAASAYADGVVVASSLVQLLLDGASHDELGDRTRALRAALDEEPLRELASAIKH